MTAGGQERALSKEELVQAGRRKLDEFRRKKAAAKTAAAASAPAPDRPGSKTQPPSTGSSDAPNGDHVASDGPPAVGADRGAVPGERRARSASPAAMGLASGYAALSDSYQSDGDGRGGDGGDGGPASSGLGSVQRESFNSDNAPSAHGPSPPQDAQPPASASPGPASGHPPPSGSISDLPISFDVQNASFDSTTTGPDLAPPGSLLPVSFSAPGTSFDSQASSRAHLSSENLWDPTRGAGRTTPQHQASPESPVPALDFSRLGSASRPGQQNVNAGIWNATGPSGGAGGSGQLARDQPTSTTSTVVFPMSSITRSLSFGEAEGGENDYGGAGMPPAPFSSPRTGGGDDYGLARVSPETAPSAVSPQTVEIISTPRGSTTETGTDLFSERTGSYRDQSRDPFGMPTAGNSYSFAGLQAHIDDLTQEKYELQRGMESQAKMAQSLAEENEALAERFNGQGRELEAARKELEQCRAEVRAQGMAMESLANERDGCKAGAQEALERVQAMVEENVGLEERVRELRVKEIRLTKQLEDSQEECRSLGSVLQKLRGERDRLLEAGPKGQPEGTEGKGPGEEGNPKSHMAPPSPPVQTRSTGMQTEPIPPDTPPPAPSAPHTPQQEALALGRTRDLGAGPTGQDLGPREELVPDVAPLALLGTLTAEVSGLGDEEGRVMGAIDGLLDGLQEQRRVMVARLHASKAEITNLRAANQDLSRKLQSQTHKLELSLRSNGGLGQQPYDDRPVSPPISPAKSEPIAMRPREQHPPQQRGWVGWMFGQPRQLARGRLT